MLARPRSLAALCRGRRSDRWRRRERRRKRERGRSRDRGRTAGAAAARWQRHASRFATRLAQLALGLAFDELLGDPRRYHPVAGFGSLAAAVEGVLRWRGLGARRPATRATRARVAGAAGASLLAGAVAGAALVGGAAGAAALVERAGSWATRRLGRGRPLGRVLAGAAVVWVCVGRRSLLREVEAVAQATARGDVEAARARLPALCGRDPQALDAPALRRAVVESLAENLNDALLSTLVWGLLAGPAGAAAHRAANTLDAMWGYRDERYRHFGRFAARLDDLLGWPGARLGVLLTALRAPLVGGSARGVLAAVRRFGHLHPSPNAGPMEAAFAGALGVRLGGPVRYGGRLERRPWLGEGRDPSDQTVRDALRLAGA
ncbi:adenosylcobinamide-phosphate synthase [Thermoleophilum album]|uniref:Cobalamin biosynthesis protein CobD n=1 Tax=Thermoleophilum album TaxID=29539 RepID=A0A1H6FU32_THEAL|nr:adenosylcobinamide-phosphate synthase [Thermoleophilum album]